MKKEDQSLRNSQEVIEPSFDDASYQQDMRVDPLTTQQAIQQELQEIQSAQNERKQKADSERAAKQAEDEKKALMEQLRKELADDSGATGEPK